MLLTQSQLTALAQAVGTALAARGTLYDAAIRFRFARGMVDFLPKLPVVPSPDLQLDLDLTNLATVGRLADGRVPVEIWLRNAIDVLQTQQQVTVLQQMLALVAARVSGAPPVEDASAPDVLPGSLPGGLEATVHRDDTLPFWFVTGAQQVGAAVAQLRVPEYANGQLRLDKGEPVVHLGTGWLAAPDLLVTNWHVVNARAEGAAAAGEADLALQGRALVARFDYDADGREGTSLKAAALEASDRALDYAVVRLSAPAAGRTPLVLATSPLQVAGIGDYVAVNIVQHPGGLPKRVAIRDNLVYRAQYPTVSYFTDTAGGASGAPVCTDDWRVVALHRAWRAVPSVQYLGRPTAIVNEGTQVAAIVAHLAQHHPKFHHEILGT